MKPADLDAVEAAALRDAPRCAACGALATRACVGCHSTWCGSHDGTAGAPPCRDGMARLREDVRLTLARALREAWAERDSARESAMADEVVMRMVAHRLGMPLDATAPLAAVATGAMAAVDKLRAGSARADRLAHAVNLRDAILARAGAKFGWPSGLSVTSGWRDRMCDAVDETAARISRLENLVAQARESYPRAEVLRALDAAGVEGVGIVDRVRRLVSDRDASRAQCEALALCIEPVVDGATGDGGAR